MLLDFMQKNKIMIYLMLVAILGYFSKYGFNLVLTHYLTPSLYGDFNLALMVLGILATLSLLGTNTASKRFLSHYLHHQHENLLRDYIQWNTRVIRVSFSICIILGVGSYLIMHMLHIWQVKDIRTYHLTIYMLWLAPLASLLSLINSYLLCANYPVSYAVIGNSSSFFSMIFFFMMVLLYQSKDISSLMLLTVLSMGVITLILIDFVLIMKKSPYLFQHIARALAVKEKPQTDPIWFAVSSRLAMNGLFCSFIFSLDLIILKLLSPHPDATGYYAVTITIASSLFVIPQNLYTVIKAKVSQLMSSEEGKQQLEQVIRHLNRVSIIVTIVLAILILSGSKELLHHFGVSYVQADPILKILIVGFCIGAFAQAPKTILAYSGHEKTLLFISISELIMMVFLCTFLTILYDIKGMAIASSVTIISRTLLFHGLAYRKTQLKTYVV